LQSAQIANGGNEPKLRCIKNYHRHRMGEHGGATWGGAWWGHSPSLILKFDIMLLTFW